MPSSSKSGECVRVMVRIRPLNSKEKQDGREIIATANKDRAEICVKNPSTDASEPPKTFTFDATFPDNTTQQEVYDVAATEIVEAVMSGYNGTVFAYGQTGAGKSHTMEGYPDPPELRGIIPNSFKHIFDKVAVTKNKEFLIRASYLEIYNEEVRDLLSKDPKNQLELKENIDTGVYVKDLTSIAVKDAAEIDHVMQTGKKNRSVGSTLMNQTSSRSHSIFTIVVECAETIGKNDHLCMGKLNLVDLAGSERQSKTGATGDRLKEATKINMSLSALGNVISALVEAKSKHIPYRDSKLTRLLQDSLGGNTKTVMIANCGPAEYNYDETVTTLRYASRAKQIKNKPKINEDPKDAMLRQFQDELAALRAQLASHSSGYTTVMQDGKEVLVPSGGGSDAKEEVVEVEKIVEKVVIEKGISKERAREIEEKAARDKEIIAKRSKLEQELAAKDIAAASRNKLEVEKKLAEEHAREEKWKAEQAALEKKLQDMEKKLLIGGDMMDKAARQEDELRRANIALQEKKRQELQLARELAEREEANLMMEEQYTSLQEEAESKTKKLRKVWTKVKELQSEIKTVQKGFGTDSEDMLDTIRDLSGLLKMESLAIDYFIPTEEFPKLEQCAEWVEEEEEWRMENVHLAGNNNNEKRKGSLDKHNDLDPASVEFQNPYLAYTDDQDGLCRVIDLEPSQRRSGKSKSSSTSKKKSKRPGTASSRSRRS